MRNPTNPTRLAAFRACNEAARIADIAANNWNNVAIVANATWGSHDSAIATHHPAVAPAMASESDAMEAADDAANAMDANPDDTLHVDQWGHGEAFELIDRLGEQEERPGCKASTIRNSYRKQARAWRRQARALAEADVQ